MQTNLDQRSIISILAADIVDSTALVLGTEPDEVQEILDRNFNRIRDSVERQGGTVVSFNGDGALAVFGWPRALDRHADHACSAAWDIQSSGDARAPSLRIGIHSGLAGVRHIDFESGHRLDIVGEAVHLAVALQKHAPRGSVLISGQTRNLCQASLATVPHTTPQTIQPVLPEAYLLNGIGSTATPRNAARHFSSLIVGRKEELAQISGVLPRSRSGSYVLSIIGEPGIGKTRLAAEAAHMAGSQGIAVDAVYCDPLKHAAPFSAFRCAIDQVLPEKPEAAASVLDAFIAQEQLAPDLAQTVRHILNPKSTNDRPHSQVLPELINRALCRLYLGQRNEGPRLLLVEDAQWIDAESLACIAAIRRVGAENGCLVIATGRPEAAGALEPLSDRRLQLGTLDTESMNTLAGQFDVESKVPSDVVAEAVRRSAGVPIILEEYMRSALHGNLTSVPDTPFGLKSLIHMRINRIPAEERALLLALGQFGEEVEYAVAQTALDITPDVLDARLLLLTDLGFLHDQWTPAIRFRHALIADSCAEMTPRRQSHAVHHAALEAIETHHQGDTRQLGRLAFHAMRAGDDSKAIEYLREALREARRTSSRQSLKLIFEEALRCIERLHPETDDLLADFVIMSFDSQHQIGESARMAPLLRRALKAVRAQKKDDRLCIILCHLGMAGWLDAEYAAGLAHAQEAYRISQTLDRFPLIHYAQHTLATLLHVTGDAEKAINLMHGLCQQFDGSLRTVRLGSAEIPGSIARGFLAEFLVEVGRYHAAIESGHDALDIALSQSEPFSEVMARIGLGRAYLHASDPLRAIEILEPAKAVLEDFGFAPSDPTVSGLLATAMARAGRGRDGLRISQAVFDRDRARPPHALHRLYAGHTEALWAAEGAQASLASATRAIEYARTRGALTNLVELLGLRARIWAELDPDAAEIDTDLMARNEVCRKKGLVGWDPGLPSR